MSSIVLGSLKNGEEVMAYTLSNDNGMSVTLLNYGGIIQSIKVPCKEGLREVVLGYDMIEDYEENPSYIGAIIGRTAGRLDKGCLKVANIEYFLSDANEAHLLHGGPKGFHQKIMDATFMKLPSGDQLRLRFSALKIEDGFPADVDMEIIYQLSRGENSLKITLKGISDEKTYLNLTNHSYFNLSENNDETIENHLLELNADTYAPVDATGLPLADWLSVEGNALDFTTMKAVGLALSSDMDQINRCKGIDHPFAIIRRDHVQGLIKASTLKSPNGDLILEVFTTQGHLVVYSGNYLSAGEVPSGKTFADYQGICFETQEKPNLVNTHPALCHFTEAGDPYYEEIKYSFHC